MGASGFGVVVGAGGVAVLEVGGDPAVPVGVDGGEVLEGVEGGGELVFGVGHVQQYPESQPSAPISGPNSVSPAAEMVSDRRVRLRAPFLVR